MQSTEISYGVSSQTQVVTPSVETDYSGQALRQAHVVYRVSNIHARNKSPGSLVDRGANGGLLGADGRVIHQYNKTVDVTGIDNHEVNGLRIVNAVAIAHSQKGPVILVLNQYAYVGTGRTIHS